MKLPCSPGYLSLLHTKLPYSTGLLSLLVVQFNRFKSFEMHPTYVKLPYSPVLLAMAFLLLFFFFEGGKSRRILFLQNFHESSV